MPYITQADRPHFEAAISVLIKELNRNPHPGRINYIISRILADQYNGTYEGINRIMGILECVKQEFYARIARPYEDTKLIENGDVY